MRDLRNCRSLTLRVGILQSADRRSATSGLARCFLQTIEAGHATYHNTHPGVYRDDYCRCCDCDIVVPGRHIGAEIEDDREILFDELICGNLPEEQLNLTGRSAMTSYVG